MQTGDKIAKLRKEKNLTQEQLAQIMNVSRQSISKWESNISYPDTDKLIQMSDLFECTMDYLLKDTIEEKNSGDYYKEQPGQRKDGYNESGQIETGQMENEQKTIQITLGRMCYEYISPKKVFGMPLVHICIGKGKVAKGVIAVGLRAKGIISFGLLSMGVISGGLLSFGGIAFGTFALGLLSFGAIVAGIIAFGAIAIGIVAVGACAIGLFSCGALANGYYVAIGDTAIGKIGIGQSNTNAEIAIVRQWKSSAYQLWQNGVGEYITREEVIALIDQNVPHYLGFFKWVIELFV